MHGIRIIGIAVMVVCACVSPNARVIDEPSFTLPKQALTRVRSGSSYCDGILVAPSEVLVSTNCAADPYRKHVKFADETYQEIKPQRMTEEQIILSFAKPRNPKHAVLLAPAASKKKGPFHVLDAEGKWWQGNTLPLRSESQELGQQPVLDSQGRFVGFNRLHLKSTANGAPIDEWTPVKNPRVWKTQLGLVLPSLALRSWEPKQHSRYISHLGALVGVVSYGEWGIQGETYLHTRADAVSLRYRWEFASDFTDTTLAIIPFVEQYWDEDRVLWWRLGSGIEVGPYLHCSVLAGVHQDRVQAELVWSIWAPIWSLVRETS